MKKAHQKKRYLNVAVWILFLFTANAIYAQDSLQIVNKLRQVYNSVPKREISFKDFLRINMHIYKPDGGTNAINSAAISNIALSGNCNAVQSFCSNGDFESGKIDMTQWLGAYGFFNGIPDPTTMTTGFMDGILSSGNAHQTIVGKGRDPVTGINQLPPNGGNYALRLGNTEVGNGTELIGKKIKVDSSTAILSFSFAVVFQDPGHALADQPAFTVRVFDCATGQEITGVCNLGNGSNKTISDSKNPFFQSTNGGYGLIAFRDWTRGEIFLSNYIGRTVTILFINNDCNLGGHFGYTYLDNFCTSTTFLREPSDNLKGNGVVQNNINAISNLIDSTSLNRYGVSADGVTKLLIIKRSTQILTITLPSAKDGTLSSLSDQTTKAGTIDVAPVINAKGESVVMAVYTAPDSYGTAQALDRNGRTSKISVQEKGNPSTNEDIAFNIFTPPVILVHGMWSKPAVWRDGGFYQSLKNANFPEVELADYSNSNYTTFMPSINPATYPSGVKSLYTSVPKAIRFYKNSSIAVSQVDVVGHSLGGLMTRSFTQTPDNKVAANFSQGYVHKLITLGTPHLGSPLGPFLYDRRNNFIWVVPLVTNAILKVPFSITLGQAMALAGQPIGSAHEAFAPGSAAYQALSSTNVKSFAVAGSYMPNETTGYHDLTTLLNVIQIAPPSLDNLIGDDHDLIVGVKSQKGGLSSNNVGFYPNTVHSKVLRESDVYGNQIRTETNRPTIQSKALSLLLSDNATDFATAFPAPSSVPAFTSPVVNNTLGAKPITQAQTANDYIRITSPTRGTTKLSNSKDSITLQFVTNGNVVPTYSVFLVGDIGIFTVPSAPPYLVKVPVPHNTPVGKVNIVALATDASGAMFGDTASIFIQPAGSLIGVAVTPDDLVLDSLYNQQRLSVSATYLNGIDSSFADVTNTEVGTLYFTNKGNKVVSIDKNGIVSALGVGTDSVIVYYNGLYSYVPVKVISTCKVPKPTITVNGGTLTSSSAVNNQWFLNNIIIDSATGNTYNAIEPGYYSVQVTSACSSPISDTVFVMPVVTTCNLSGLDLGPNKTVSLFYADSSCTTLSVKGLDSSALASYTFKWNTGETTSTIKVCPTATTTYSIVISKGSCTFTDSVTVFVEQCPKDIMVVAPTCGDKVTLSWNEPVDAFPSTIAIPQSIDLSQGSLIYLDSMNGHGYYISTKSYLWPDARDISKYIGGTGVNGHLVTIYDAKENKLVANHIKGTNMPPWIGMYNTGKVGNFRWVTTDSVGYTNWNVGEPNNSGGDKGNVHEPYVQMYENGTWNDEFSAEFPFITEFEKPLIRYKQISGPKNGSAHSVGTYTICYQRNNLITNQMDTCCFTFTISCPPSALCPKDTVIHIASCIGTTKIGWTEPIDTFPASIVVPTALDATNGVLTYIGALKGHGYYTSNNNYLWPVARDIANYVGGNNVNGHLATIADAAENTFVMNHAKNLFAPWIGLYNTGKVGRFRWVTSETFSYSNWAPGEPNNFGGDAKNVAEPYGQMYSANGTWNDGANVSEPFVAEFEKALIHYKQIAGPTIGTMQAPGVYLICYQRNNLITDEKDTCCFNVTIDCSGAMASSAISAVTNISDGLKDALKEPTLGALKVTAYPNPSSTQFTLNITSSIKEKVTMQLFDMVGRIIETKDGMAPNQIIQVGSHLNAGIYYIHLKQGIKTVVLKMVKQSH